MYMIKSKQRQQGPVHQLDQPREVRWSCATRATLALNLNSLLIFFTCCSCAVGERSISESPESPSRFWRNRSPQCCRSSPSLKCCRGCGYPRCVQTERGWDKRGSRIESWRRRREQQAHPQYRYISSSIGHHWNLNTSEGANVTLCVFFCGLGIYCAVQVGRWHFSGVYSFWNEHGNLTGCAVRVSKNASSLVSIRVTEGQAGTEAYVLYLGQMCGLLGEKKPLSGNYLSWSCWRSPLALASAGGTDRDLAAPQFPRIL